jgi:hypothetical protein
MAKYVDHIGAFQHKGRTVEAYVMRPTGGGARGKAVPLWTVTVDGERFGVFPASPDDTEEGIRERIKRWIDEHQESP